MTEIQDPFLEAVERGRAGLNKGLKSGLDSIDKFTGNIQKKQIRLIGAQQKTGKTSYVDYSHIIAPYLLNPDADIEWIYFSYEIDEISKKAKWAALFMQLKHGIYIDSSRILSFGDENRLSDEEHAVMLKVYEEDILPLFSKIKFIERKSNPTGIYKEILKHASENGTFTMEDYVDVDGKKRQYMKSYRSNNPEKYNIIIIDHIGLVKLERGYNKKQNLDKLSEYFVILRNLLGYTFILVSQFNRDLSKTERLKFTGTDLQPSIEDFKDSSNMAEDADMVIALFNAHLYPHLDTHKDYVLEYAENCYRSWHLLASRHTLAPASKALVMAGKTGFFKELPKPEIFNAQTETVNDFIFNTNQ